MSSDVVTGEHGGLTITVQNDINDVRVVIKTVIGRRVFTSTKNPRGGLFHHVSPLTGAKPILTADDDDEPVVRDIRTDDVFADGEGDGLRLNIPTHINTTSGRAPCLSLDGLNGPWLAGTADGNLPSPIRMHLSVGTGQH